MDIINIHPIEINPIGIVHSLQQDTAGMPINGQQASIEIFPEYAGGLKRIEEHSHLWILSWFHQANQKVIETVPGKVNPNAPVYGVFGIRTPGRPNPIGLSLVKLDQIQGNQLIVQNLDAIDGSPVLDIKPYYEQDIIFSPRAPYIRPQQKEMRRQIFRTEALLHHQEECEGLLLAIRMALIVEEELGKLNSPDLLVSVAGSACLADTIQGLTRARVANPPRFHFVESEDNMLVRWKKGARELKFVPKHTSFTKEELNILSDEELFNIDCSSHFIF